MDLDMINLKPVLFTNLNEIMHDELKGLYLNLIKDSISSEGTYTYIKLPIVKNYDKMGKKIKEIIEHILIPIFNKSKTS